MKRKYINFTLALFVYGVFISGVEASLLVEEINPRKRLTAVLEGFRTLPVSTDFNSADSCSELVEIGGREILYKKAWKELETENGLLWVMLPYGFSKADLVALEVSAEDELQTLLLSWTPRFDMLVSDRLHYSGFTRHEGHCFSLSGLPPEIGANIVQLKLREGDALVEADGKEAADVVDPKDAV